jgi:hypothetical protein
VSDGLADAGVACAPGRASERDRCRKLAAFRAFRSFSALFAFFAFFRVLGDFTRFRRNFA